MTIWISLSLAAILSLGFTGVMRKYAASRNLVDVPNQRSSHTSTTPSGGGLAIVLSFQLIAGYWAYSGYLEQSQFWLYLIAGSWVAAIGLLDDIFNLPAKWRLLFHFAVALLVVYWFGGMPAFILAGHKIELAWFGSTIAVFFLVWLLNLYNFMDGIDGIAAIEVITVCIGGVLIYGFTDNFSLQSMAPLLLAASAAGFLFWNFPKARIFMGDSGSGYLGLMVGIFAMQFAWLSPEYMWSWLILLGCFIVDATFTLFRRIVNGEKFYEAHRNHAYQNASRRYQSHVRVTLACAAINVIWLLPIALIVAIGEFDGVFGLLLAYLPLIWIAHKFKAGYSNSN